MIADSDPHEGNWSGSFIETPFQKSGWKIFSNIFLEKMDKRNSYAKININRFSTFESSSTGVRFYIDWWNQTCSCWGKSVWKARCINNDGTFQNFRTIVIVTQDTKPLIYQTSTPLQVEQFWLRPKCQNLAMFSRRKVSGNIDETQNYLSFSVFLQSGDHRTACSSRSSFEVTSHFVTPEKLGWWEKLIPLNWKKKSNFYKFS